MTFQFENSSTGSYKRSHQFFVRLQNLSWSTSPRDIKDFFGGLYVPQGGISIQGKNAFVSFENWETILAAMLRDKRTIHGEKILLSIVELDEVRKLTDRHIQRSLYFLSMCRTPSMDNSASTPASSGGRRTIRPTPITKFDAANSEINPAFMSEEISTPVSIFSGTTSMKDVCKARMRYNLFQKKITPTSVVNMQELLSLFSPSELQRIPVRRGLKKLRLDYS